MDKSIIYIILIASAMIVAAIYIMYQDMQFRATAPCEQLANRTIQNVPLRCINEMKR